MGNKMRQTRRDRLHRRILGSRSCSKRSVWLLETSREGRGMVRRSTDDGEKVVLPGTSIEGN
jgi:hypothetical protein